MGTPLASGGNAICGTTYTSSPAHRACSPLSPPIPTRFKSYSKYPPCYKDVAFWISDAFTENNL